MKKVFIFLLVAICVSNSSMGQGSKSAGGAGGAGGAGSAGSGGAGGGGAAGGASSNLYGFRFYLKDKNGKKELFGKFLGLNKPKKLRKDFGLIVPNYDDCDTKKPAYTFHKFYPEINKYNSSKLKKDTASERKYEEKIMSETEFGNLSFSNATASDTLKINTLYNNNNKIVDDELKGKNGYYIYAIDTVNIPIDPKLTISQSPQQSYSITVSPNKDSTYSLKLMPPGVTTPTVCATKPTIITYDNTGRVKTKKIGVYLKSMSPDGNELTFKLWNNNDSTKNHNKKHPISPPDAEHPFAADSAFIYKINWISKHYTKTDPKYHFNLGFYTKYLVPVSTPITFLIGNDSKNERRWNSNFLSAGMAYGWAWGRTKFFRNNQYAPKNFYIGVGPVLAISATTIQAKDFNNDSTVYRLAVLDTPHLVANNEYKALSRLTGGSVTTGSYTAPLIQLGGHLGVSIGPIEIMGVCGWGWALGYPTHDWAFQGKPFVSFGLGLSLFNLSVQGGI